MKSTPHPHQAHHLLGEVLCPRKKITQKKIIRQKKKCQRKKSRHLLGEVSDDGGEVASPEGEHPLVGQGSLHAVANPSVASVQSALL